MNVSRRDNQIAYEVTPDHGELQGVVHPLDPAYRHKLLHVLSRSSVYYTMFYIVIYRVSIYSYRVIYSVWHKLEKERLSHKGRHAPGLSSFRQLLREIQRFRSRMEGRLRYR